VTAGRAGAALATALDEVRARPLHAAMAAAVAGLLAGPRAPVVVPRRGAAGAAPVAVAGEPGGPPQAPVSLNTATAEQLDTLDGVGPATASKILEYRRQHGGFRSIDDLGEIPGIGPKRLAALRGKVQL